METTTTRERNSVVALIMAAVAVTKDVFAKRRIAAGQVAQFSGHLNRAMDNGLTQPQAAEVLTHLAFYAGWPNIFSTMPVAKDVFDKRPKS